MKYKKNLALIECLAERLLNRHDLAFRIHHIYYDLETGNMRLFVDVNKAIIVEPNVLEQVPNYTKLLMYIEDKYRKGVFK